MCPCLGSLHWGPEQPSTRDFSVERGPLRCLREALVTTKAPAGGSAPGATCPPKCPPTVHHAAPRGAPAMLLSWTFFSAAESLTFLFFPPPGSPWERRGAWGPRRTREECECLEWLWGGALLDVSKCPLNADTSPATFYLEL